MIVRKFLIRQSYIRNNITVVHYKQRILQLLYEIQRFMNQSAVEQTTEKFVN
jgi:hypothetical protein